MKHILSIFLLLCTLCLDLQGKHEVPLHTQWNEIPLLLREYLLAVSDNLPDQATQATEKIFLARQAELGTITLQPYYGTKMGQDLSDLLKFQAMHLVDFINAAKKDDAKKMESELATLKQNATAISCLISKVNPYITFCKMQDMLSKYLDLVSAMVTDRLKMKWQEDIENYAKVRSHYNELASFLSEAITNAFPPKEEPKAKSSV